MEGKEKPINLFFYFLITVIKMNVREVIVAVYGLAFIVLAFGLITTPTSVWSHMETAQIATTILGVVLAFAGVLMAYYVKIDGEKLSLYHHFIDSLYDDVGDLKRQLGELKKNKQ